MTRFDYWEYFAISKFPIDKGIIIWQGEYFNREWLTPERKAYYTDHLISDKEIEGVEFPKEMNRKLIALIKKHPEDITNERVINHIDTLRGAVMGDREIDHRLEETRKVLKKRSGPYKYFQNKTYSKDDTEELLKKAKKDLQYPGKTLDKIFAVYKGDSRGKTPLNKLADLTSRDFAIYKSVLQTLSKPRQTKPYKYHLKTTYTLEEAYKRVSDEDLGKESVEEIYENYKKLNDSLMPVLKNKRLAMQCMKKMSDSPGCSGAFIDNGNLILITNHPH